MRTSTLPRGASVVIGSLLILALPGVALANCEVGLANRTFACLVQSDFSSSPFVDCFTFTSPGNQSSHFDLTIAGLGDTLSCACEAVGNRKSFSFNASNSFMCTSTYAPFSYMGITFNGKVKIGKPLIKKGQAVNEYGDCFVFECVEDAFCLSTTALSSREAGINPYAGPSTP